MWAIREAVATEDPAEAVLATVAASAEHWERQGHILLTLKAVSELEPGAIALIDDQRRDQRDGMERLARGLERDGRLVVLTRAQAAAALHMITSVESFMELRRNAGLSLAATKRVVTAMAAGLFDLEPLLSRRGRPRRWRRGSSSTRRRVRRRTPRSARTSGRRGRGRSSAGGR